jgi:hypothetical protein
VAVSTVANIKQALVATMRANNPLKNAVTGFYEGFAPSATAYPFVTYTVAFAPYDFAWGSVTIRTAFDVNVFAENPVDANNIDALVLAALHNVELSVTGQSTLICRRVGDLSSQDVDEEGKKVYQVGGTYEIWTHQADS